MVAVASLRPGTGAPALAELRAHTRRTLAPYKSPKAVCWVDRVQRSPAGKPDYAWARGVAEAAAGAGAPSGAGGAQRATAAESVTPT